MRGASRGGKDVGTRALETRRRSKQRRQEAQPYDEATRTCTDEVRGHQQKRRSETTAVREALRHRPGQYEVLVPRQWTCSICHRDPTCGPNSGITRAWSPVTGGSTPSSHHHQAQQPKGGLWRLRGRPRADPGPRRPPTPVPRGGGGRTKLLPRSNGGRGSRGSSSRGRGALPHGLGRGPCGG